MDFLRLMAKIFSFEQVVKMFFNQRWMRRIAFFGLYGGLFAGFSSFIFSQTTLDSSADAFTLYLEGKYEQSLSLSRASLSRNPENIEAAVLSSWNLLFLERYEEALEIAQQVLRMRQDARFFEISGQALFFLGRSEESRMNFIQYIRLAPQGYRVPLSYFFLARIYAQEKKWHDALISLDLAFRKNNGRFSMVSWYILQGEIYAQLNWKESEKETYVRAIREYPQSKELQALSEQVSRF